MATSILADLAAGSVAAQSSVESNKTPFLPDRVVTAHIAPSADMAGTDAVIVIQSSPDDSAWTTVMTMTGIGHKVADIVLAKFMRANVTTAAGTTDGEYSAWLQTGD